MAMRYKAPSEIAKIEKASQALVTIMDSIDHMICPGTTTLQINAEIERGISATGGHPLFKGYPPHSRAKYPFCCCTNVNNQVTNAAPTNRRLVNGDILKVQVGIEVDGWCSKVHHAYPIGQISPSRKRLLQTVKSALRLAIGRMVPGGSLWDVADAIQTFTEAQDYSIVKEYVGHGIGRSMHEEPKVPSFRSRELATHNVIFREGVVLQILPLVNEGTSDVKHASNGWAAVTADGRDSCLMGHIVAVEKHGPRILTFAPRDQILDETRAEGIAIIPVRDRLCVYPLEDLGIHNVIDPSTRSTIIHGSANLVLKRTRDVWGSQIQQFEDLINSPHLQESQLQKFFELHPSFLLGTDYESVRSNVILPNQFGNDLIPDFFLEPIVSELWEILELKLPDKPLTVGSANRKDMSRYVRQGCAQLRTYMHYFDDPKHRDAVGRKYGIWTYKPRLTLIIGRKREVSDLLWRQLELELPHVRVITYDDLLRKVKKRILV